MSRFGSLGTQYFDDAGDPLVSGKIYVYQSGGTSTAKDTYADVALTTLNTNPVILTAAGRQPNVFFSGSARMILTSGTDVQVEVRDPVGGETSDAAFSDWNTDAVYNEPDIVVGADGNFYISIVDGNEGNEPSASPGSWTQIRFIRVWNTSETYGVASIVEGSDGLLYSGRTSSNSGNNPTTDAINWQPAVEASVSAVVAAAAATFAYRNF